MILKLLLRERLTQLSVWVSFPLWLLCGKIQHTKSPFYFQHSVVNTNRALVKIKSYSMLNKTAEEKNGEKKYIFLTYKMEAQTLISELCHFPQCHCMFSTLHLPAIYYIFTVSFLVY